MKDLGAATKILERKFTRNDKRESFLYHRKSILKRYLNTSVCNDGSEYSINGTFQVFSDFVTTA